MKKVIYVCYIINLMMVMLLVFVFIAMLLKMDTVLHFVFLNNTFMNIRMALTIPILILWIYNFIVWSKKDKNVGVFFLLFFFSAIYNPFYYNRIIKNGWN